MMKIDYQYLSIILKSFLGSFVASFSLISNEIWNFIINAGGIKLILLMIIPITFLIFLANRVARNSFSTKYQIIGTIAFILIFVMIGFIITLIMGIVFDNIKLDELSYNYLEQNLSGLIKFSVLLAVVSGVSANIDFRKHIHW